MIVLLVFFLSGCNTWKKSKTFSYEEVSCSGFVSKINSDKDYILVDVRTPKEYRNGHMQNAVNISYFHSWFSDSIQKLDHSKTIYMYCQTQHRSPLASRKMKKMGFRKIVDLKGGFMKWENNHMPIVK
jgi:rhodanese-related sulfurtransferase